MTNFTLSGPIPALETLAVRITDPVSKGPGDIIPGLLPKQGQLVIAGETNAGKSLISLEIISSLVTGNPLWGSLQPLQRVGKVLYVLGEHYNEVIQKLALKTQLPMSENVWLLGPEALGYDKWMVTNGRPNPAVVEKFKKWADKSDLIIFDPLSAFCMGVEAENDNISMRIVLDTMSLITQSVGASCIVLAHLGKPSIDTFGKEHTRTKYAIRGASAVEDAATNIFYLGRQDGQSKPVFELRCRKYKGEAPESYQLLRDATTLTHTLLAATENDAMAKLRKIDLTGKLNRIQAAKPDFTYRTAVELLAALEDVPVTTMTRWLTYSA